MSDYSASSGSLGRRVTNVDGTRNITCRKCGRVIAKVAGGPITSIAECAICKGAPEENVLQQYVQTDPSRPPLPLGEEPMMFLYEEEEEIATSGKPWTGLLKPFFKALGFGSDKPKPTQEEVIAAEPKSKRVARSKRSGGLFER